MFFVFILLRQSHTPKQPLKSFKGCVIFNWPNPFRPFFFTHSIVIRTLLINSFELSINWQWNCAIGDNCDRVKSNFIQPVHFTKFDQFKMKHTKNFFIKNIKMDCTENQNPSPINNSKYSCGRNVKPKRFRAGMCIYAPLHMIS